MRDDNIKDSNVKLFKVFMYTSLAAASIIVLQNTTVIKRLQPQYQMPIDARNLAHEKIAMDTIQSNQSYVPFTPQVPNYAERPKLPTLMTQQLPSNTQQQYSGSGNDIYGLGELGVSDSASNVNLII